VLFSAKTKQNRLGAKETVREKYMKTISENPRWSEAKPSGQGFVIGGGGDRVGFDKATEQLAACVSSKRL
jgi:hypothetical protein